MPKGFLAFQVLVGESQLSILQRQLKCIILDNNGVIFKDIIEIAANYRKIGEG